MGCKRVRRLRIPANGNSHKLPVDSEVVWCNASSHSRCPCGIILLDVWVETESEDTESCGAYFREAVRDRPSILVQVFRTYEPIPKAAYHLFSVPFSGSALHLYRLSPIVYTVDTDDEPITYM